MKKKPNPFEPWKKDRSEEGTPQHASDDPGHAYADAEQGADGHTHTSGPSGPSGPRRPGTGGRQAPRREKTARLTEAEPLVPGEVLYGPGEIEINAGLEVTSMTVINASDRPIQVGSHFHFAEVNAALEFDRDAAWGKHLNVLSGGAMRFEPGAAEEVELVPIQGQRVVYGLRGLCGGRLDG